MVASGGAEIASFTSLGLTVVLHSLFVLAPAYWLVVNGARWHWGALVVPIGFWFLTSVSYPRGTGLRDMALDVAFALAIAWVGTYLGRRVRRKAMADLADKHGSK